MNTSDQLDIALTNLINQATTGTVETIPEIISDLLLWHGLVSIVHLVIGLALAYIPYRLYKYLQYGKKTELEDMPKKHREFFGSSYLEGKCDVSFDILYLLITITGIVSFAVITEGLVWIKILIAPYAWLFDYAIMLRG